MTIDPTLSDLFFNHEHPTLDAARRVPEDKRTEPVDWEACILQDATDFHRHYSGLLNTDFTPEDLAADFLRRV